jgi:superfamily II DNA or RNA helicase
MEARYGRDRRRRLSVSEARILYDRAGGRCQRCGAELGPDWHGAHLLSWSGGGATSLGNEEAWCPQCNLRLGAEDAPKLPLELREWQRVALPQILLRLTQTGRATLHAAPGAGKTLFTGATFVHLAEAGFVERLLVFVPNRVLVRQWREALANNLRVHVDDEPRDGYQELRETVGCVVTYANLATAAANHRREVERRPTLVVFDEVHHLADQRSWGRAAMTVTGDTPVLVLNTTGTLFRSTGRERIPTVTYNEVDEGLLEAVADVSVTADRLIGTELRPVDLHVCGSTIELVDLRQEEVISGEVADLKQSLMRAAHSRIIRDRVWMEGFAHHMLERLSVQERAIEEAEPLKALWVAADQYAARQAAEIINRVANADFARLVISDEPSALRTLRKAVHEPRSCCIVAVQMVTEGFDCPQVSTIAYAHNYISELYLTQMVARAMRLTSTERRIGKVLPAQVLIPDVQDLRRAFADVLISKLHMLKVDEEEPELEARWAGERVPRLPRFDLTAVTPPRLEDVVVVGEEDGVVTRSEHDDMVSILEHFGVPVVYAPRVVAASRAFSSERVLRDRTPGTTFVVPAHPRDVNKAWRDRLKMRAGWWNFNGGDVSVKDFQAEANRAAGLGPGERQGAGPVKLAAVCGWMDAAIRSRCRSLGIEPPQWLEEER